MSKPRKQESQAHAATNAAEQGLKIQREIDCSEELSFRKCTFRRSRSSIRMSFFNERLLSIFHGQCARRTSICKGSVGMAQTGLRPIW